MPATNCSTVKSPVIRIGACKEVGRLAFCVGIVFVRVNRFVRRWECAIEVGRELDVRPSSEAAACGSFEERERVGEDSDLA
jgi:hypothetical protein